MTYWAILVETEKRVLPPTAVPMVHIGLAEEFLTGWAVE
jgi:hypothetical protein